MPSTFAHRIAIAVLGASTSCAGKGDQRQRPPTEPPRTLELLAEGTPDDRALPSASEPLRRGPCGVPLAVSPEGLMEPGAIARLQAALVDQGLLGPEEHVEGELDEATLAAVRELQERADLPTVGVPTYATVRALGLEVEELFRAGDQTCEGDVP